MSSVPTRGPQALRDYRLLEALLGRRSRRFFRGAEIPDGDSCERAEHETSVFENSRTVQRSTLRPEDTQSEFDPTIRRRSFRERRGPRF